MDLEGYAKGALRRGLAKEEIERTLAERILEVRDIPLDSTTRISQAVVEEAVLRSQLEGVSFSGA